MAADQGGEILDHYSVMGLPSGEEGESLTLDEIKKAFRVQSLARHPDKRPDDPAATADFQRLCASYDALRDPSARRLLDARLRLSRPRPRPPRPREKTNPASTSTSTGTGTGTGEDAAEPEVCKHKYVEPELCEQRYAEFQKYMADFQKRRAENEKRRAERKASYGERIASLFSEDVEVLILNNILPYAIFLVVFSLI